jgi:transcriptional regulator with XRE-family HTH domain
MALALSAGVSSRHVSFVETGRARPGREILLRLASALELSDDEQKALLAAAGFEAPQAPARAPSARQLGPLVGPIRAILARLEPLPAILLDARWDLLMPNAAYVRLSTVLRGSSPFPRGALELTDAPRPNRLRELIDPRVREAILNWHEVARAALSRARLEADLSRDPALHTLLREVATEGAGLPDASCEEPLFPIRVDVRLGGGARIRLFSLVTAWATAYPGLRIEMLHPANEAATRALVKLAAWRPGDADTTPSLRRSSRILPPSHSRGEGGARHESW